MIKDGYNIFGYRPAGKKYAPGLTHKGMQKILKYGIAFCEKECMAVIG